MKATFRTGFAALALVVLSAALFLASCAKKSGEPTMFTGKTHTQQELRAELGFVGNYGKLSYAQVSEAWLQWAYADFRAELSAGQFGVVKWDDRSQCTLFATAFEVFCQKRYFAQAFHSSIPAPGVAVGTIWFQPAPGQGHAVNVVRTERGVRYLEPQTGRFLELTATQLSSIYFRKFD